MAYTSDLKLQQAIANGGAMNSGRTDIMPVSIPMQTQKPTVEGPGTLDTVTAAFRQHNSFSAVYDAFANPYTGDKTFDRDFSPRRKAIAEGYAQYADEFNWVRNQEEYEFVKQRVNDSKASKAVIENAGGVGVASAVAASILDPVSLLSFMVPGIGEARLAQIGNTALRVGARGLGYGGAAIAAGAAQTGVLNTLRPSVNSDSVSAQYGLDGHGTQMAASAGIGLALFGAAGRAVSKASKTAVGKAIDSLMVDANGALLPATATPAQTATATAVNAAGSKLYENIGTQLVEGTVRKGSAGLLNSIGMELAKSPFDAMRRWGQKLSPDIMQRVETKAGPESINAVATPHDVKLIAMLEGNADVHAFGNELIESKKALDTLKSITPAEQQEIFQQMTVMGLGPKTIDDVTPASIQRFFHELVGYAAANGDKHVIPQVEKAALAMRKIFDRDWGRITTLGLDTVSNVARSAPGYFTTVYNKQGVATRQLDFINAIHPHLEQSLIAAGVPVADAAREAMNLAVSATNKIVGAGTASGAGLMHALKQQGPMGALAARTLDVPYEALAPFLEHDAYKVLNTYKRGVEPQLALKEVFGHTTFGEFRDVVMLPERDRVKNALIESGKTATGDELTKINSELGGFDKAWSEGEKHIEALFDGMIGKTKMAENAHTGLATAGRIARKGVGLVTLSGQVLSSIVDIPRQVMTYGVTPVMGAWANYLASSAFRAMGKETAERVGVALELTAHKLKSAGESTMSGYEREVIGHAQNALERGVNSAGETFQWMNGAMLWNDGIRTTTALLAQDRLLNVAEKGWANLKKTDREWLAVLGVDESMLTRIQTGAKSNISKLRGFAHTEVENWADLDAARSFKLAVLKDAHTTANTPFHGTMPTWYDSEAGKFIWQFKSFISANFQQTVMVGLQRADARVFMGVVTAVATGMATSTIKDMLSASVDKKEKTLAHHVWEGFDRSGVADMPLSLAAYLDTIQAMGTGKSVLPFANNDRRPHNWKDVVAGPTGGYVDRVGAAAKHLQDKGLDEQGQQMAMGVTPFHKTWGVDVGRVLIDAVHGNTKYIDKVVDAFKKTFPSMDFDQPLHEPAK